jgi:hypothetical protein
MIDYKQIAKEFGEADQESSKTLNVKPIFNWLEGIREMELSEDELYLFTMAAYKIRDEIDMALNGDVYDDE